MAEADPGVLQYPAAQSSEMDVEPTQVFIYEPGTDKWDLIKNTVVFLVGHAMPHDEFQDIYPRLNAIFPGPFMLHKIPGEQSSYRRLNTRLLVCIGPREEKRLAKLVYEGRQKKPRQREFEFRVYSDYLDASEMFVWEDYIKNSFRVPKALMDSMLAAIDAADAVTPPPPGPPPTPPPPGPPPPPGGEGPPPGDDGDAGSAGGRGGRDASSSSGPGAASSSGTSGGRPTMPKRTFYGYQRSFGEWVAEVGLA